MALQKLVDSHKFGGPVGQEDSAMTKTAIGLMSGTSLDGVDVALLETDGKRVSAFGPSGYRPYTEPERNVLRQALFEAVQLTDRDARPGVLAEAERVVTLAHADAVATFIAHNHLQPETIDIIGFHGQTVLHRPAQRLTVQIGDAKAMLAQGHPHPRRCTIFAPPTWLPAGRARRLVPVYHRALAQSLEPVGGPSCRGQYRRRLQYYLYRWRRQC